MRYQDPQLSEMLAAEYVLGTLKGGARRRFERLMHAHPALRNRVREWELQLNRLAPSAPPVTPPPATWNALQQRLFSDAPPSTPWFQRLAFWRYLGIGSSLVAGLLAAILFVGPFQEAPGYVVIINDPAQQPVWMLTAPAGMEQFYVKNLKAMDIPEDLGCLLWLRPEDSQDFYALGVLPDEQGEDRVLEIPKTMRPMLPGKLLVTVEDMRGPTPPVRPTGPLVYEGEWLPVRKI